MPLFFCYKTLWCQSVPTVYTGGVCQVRQLGVPSGRKQQPNHYVRRHGDLMQSHDPLPNGQTNERHDHHVKQSPKQKHAFVNRDVDHFDGFNLVDESRDTASFQKQQAHDDGLSQVFCLNKLNTRGKSLKFCRNLPFFLHQIHITPTIINTSDMAEEFKGGKAAKSGFRELMNKLDVAVKYSSNWVFEWTPFILTICYWVASICFYVACDEGTIKGFYYFFMVINFYIAACTVIEAFLGISPLRDARAAAIRVNTCGEFPTPDELLPILDIVIVAYLPNEQDIVMDQVNYALEEIVYPRDKLRINLLYNTPKPIEPLETELIEMEKQHGGLLRVTKVVGSKSKADNLNFFFTLDTGAEIIAVFDCDHFPHPYNARWAAERFIADPTVDIVQGRCIVYNSKETFFTRMIALEFDKIYAVSHPGRSRLFSFGLFCGSNGYWKAELLRGHQMHGHMLCEDIDSALRAYGEGKRAVHDMNVKSYEMAPTFWMAFWKQRMRWTQGWTQASIRHAHMIWDNPPNGTRCLSERYGLLSLIIVRELSYYLVTQHTCLLFSFLITGWPKNSGELARLIFFRYALSEWFLFLTVGSLIVTLWITEIVRSEFTSFYDMILFSAVYVPYLILQGTMGIYGHFREIIGYSSWNPTSRK